MKEKFPALTLLTDSSLSNLKTGTVDRVALCFSRIPVVGRTHQQRCKRPEEREAGGQAGELLPNAEAHSHTHTHALANTHTTCKILSAMLKKQKLAKTKTPKLTLLMHHYSLIVRSRCQVNKINRSLLKFERIFHCKLKY